MTLAERILHGRPLRFSLVGAMGVVVNAGVFHLLRFWIGLPLEIASPVAIAAAIFHNFRGNNAWTYRQRPHRDGRDWWGRLLRYYLSSSLGAAINYSVLLLLVHQFSWNEHLANFTGIVAGMASNFLLSEFWVFRSRGPR